MNIYTLDAIEVVGVIVLLLAGLTASVTFFSSSSRGGGLLLAAMVLGASGLALIVIAPQVIHDPGLSRPHHDAVIKSIKLASLSNTTTTTSSTSDSFLNTTTTTQQTPIYQYVRQNSDGSVNLATIDGSTRVIEDASASTARIDTTQCTYNNASDRSQWGPCGDQITTIHIPKGSIVRNFSIDSSRR